jgi:hypothetical protein
VLNPEPRYVTNSRPVAPLRGVVLFPAVTNDIAGTDQVSPILAYASKSAVPAAALKVLFLVPPVSRF